MLFSHSFYRSMKRPGGSRRLALVASMVGMLTGLSLLGAHGQAQAQSNAGHAGHANHWPTKPVRLLVTLSPGSTSDILARTVADQLSKSLGQSFVVENRPGAGGNIAGEVVARSAPDGYTLLLATISSHGINPALYAKMPYDAVRDFVPVINLASSPNALIVGMDVPVNSVKELVAWVKSKPAGEVNYASAGNGTSMHLGGELFNALTGAKTTHIPYKGSPEAITETLAGRIDYFFAPLVSALPMIKAGKLIPLAVGTTKRSGLLPDVPTLEESGIAKADYLFWIGMLVSSKTPRDVVEKINQVTLKALQSPEVRERLTSLGADPLPMSPGQFDAMIRDEMVSNAAIIKAAGIKPE